MEVSVQLHTSAALFPGKQPPIRMRRRLDLPRNQFGHCGEDYPECNHDFLVAQIVNLVAVSAELFRFTLVYL
jgi:hypothetical protein